eukprot:GFYU01005509.1.p1 GENE.GFYU01005509.1~~GFYU01005509.1.p1  ORF type:complete len:438 (-),score=80.97 GFYU01005509.1:117-1430(-)
MCDTVPTVAQVTTGGPQEQSRQSPYCHITTSAAAAVRVGDGVAVTWRPVRRDTSISTCTYVVYLVVAVLCALTHVCHSDVIVDQWQHPSALQFNHTHHVSEWWATVLRFALVGGNTPVELTECVSQYTQEGDSTSSEHVVKNRLIEACVTDLHEGDRCATHPLVQESQIADMLRVQLRTLILNSCDHDEWSDSDHAKCCNLIPKSSNLINGLGAMHGVEYRDAKRLRTFCANVALVHNSLQVQRHSRITKDVCFRQLHYFMSTCWRSSAAAKGESFSNILRSRCVELALPREVIMSGVRDVSASPPQDQESGQYGQGGDVDAVTAGDVGETVKGDREIHDAISVLERGAEDTNPSTNTGGDTVIQSRCHAHVIDRVARLCDAHVTLHGDVIKRLREKRTFCTEFVEVLYPTVFSSSHPHPHPRGDRDTQQSNQHDEL